MKGCVQWNSVYSSDVTLSGDRTLSATSVGQCLTHWATRATVVNLIHYDTSLSIGLHLDLHSRMCLL